MTSRITTTVLRTLAIMLVVFACIVSCGCSQSKSEPQSSELSASDTPAPAQDPLDAAVSEKLASMSLEQKVAQMFIVNPEQLLDGVDPVVQADATTETALQEYPVGGMIFFSQNIEDPDQTKAMLETVQSFATQDEGLPLFLCVDEEGGTVARVASNENFDVAQVGDMSDIGATGDTSKAADVGTTLGTYLTDLGFNVDFAPDTDVYDPSKSSIMAQRSFGSDPQVVSDMAVAQLGAMKAEGLLGCAKHFPGHGSVSGDSHENEVVTQKTLAELQADDLVPFEGAIAADVPFVMVGHISCPQVTGSDIPASLSPQMVGSLLRSEMGYDGIITTDSLGMGAITEAYTPGDAAIAAIQAGNDIVLHSPDFKTAYQAVVDAVNAGTISQDRIDESVTRILRAKMSLNG